MAFLLFLTTQERAKNLIFEVRGPMLERASSVGRVREDVTIAVGTSEGDGRNKELIEV